MFPLGSESHKIPERNPHSMSGRETSEVGLDDHKPVGGLSIVLASVSDSARGFAELATGGRCLEHAATAISGLAHRIQKSRVNKPIC